MKKIFFFLMLLVPACIFSQQDSISTETKNYNQEKKEHHSIGLGIKAGLNFTNINSASGISNSSETGFQVGIFLDPKSHSILGSRTELLYSRQGYNYSTGLTTGSVNLDYIMLAQLMVINITHFVQIQLGTQIAYLINAKSDSAHTGTGYALLDYYNRFDFGFSGGLEVRPFMGFLVGARYNFSVTNLYKLPSSGTNTPPSYIPTESGLNLKNNLLQIYVGYRF
jgi:hypothetical protein